MQIKTILLFFIFLPVCLVGQEKNEREYRIKSTEVSQQSKKWLRDAFELPKRVKWYREENNQTISYEAKFRWKKDNYSVEFSETGAIEDIEVEREFSHLPDSIQGALQSTFNTFEGVKIYRIQEQWSGSADDLEDAMDAHEWDNIIVRFEIEFYAIIEGESSIWEGLISPEGEIIELKKVILRSTDNLLY